MPGQASGNSEAVPYDMREAAWVSGMSRLTTFLRVEGALHRLHSKGNVDEQRRDQQSAKAEDELMAGERAPGAPDRRCAPSATRT